MTTETTVNVRRTTVPRTLAVVGLIPYLRSTVASLLAGAAIFVALRRMAGALETPLGPFELLAVGVVLIALAYIAHAAAPRGRFHAGGVAVSLSMLVIAASLSLRGSNSAALFGFWSMIVGEELWAWRSLLAVPRSIKVGLPMAPPPVPASCGGDSTEVFEPAAPAADVLQQLTLRSTAEGGQEVSGWLRLGLAAGQRSGSLHVAFCPSFAELPRVEAEAVSGPGCRIKAAQVLPYGARLDVKLDEAAEEAQSVLLWFHAANPDE